jgi:hypothetical protein
MIAACESRRHCRHCGPGFRARIGVAVCPLTTEADAPPPPAVVAGWIAQEAEILARTDLTPCRRAHHEKKLASYREMLQHAKG